MQDEPDFEVGVGRNQPPQKRGKLSMRLDTMLLLMTLAAVIVGFIQARAMSLRWQTQLSRIETATGLPRIKDVTKLEVVIEEDTRTPAWTIWVPYEMTCRLRVATQGIEVPFPPQYDEYELLAGRHTIKIATSPSFPKMQLQLDGKEILVQEKSRNWNLAGKPETMIHDSVQPVENKPVVLFRRFGRIRPNPEDERELRKHRVGLLIWVEP
jgi:hypothetical protein